MRAKRAPFVVAWVLMGALLTLTLALTLLGLEAFTGNYLPWHSFLVERAFEVCLLASASITATLMLISWMRRKTTIRMLPFLPMISVPVTFITGLLGIWVAIWAGLLTYSDPSGPDFSSFILISTLLFGPISLAIAGIMSFLFRRIQDDCTSNWEKADGNA